MRSQTFTQLTPHIFRLEQPFRAPVGVWLVKSGDGWFVIDAGAPSFEDALFEQILKQTGGARPKLLILTHGHLDHAAAAQRMHDEWRVPVAAGRLEIPYLTGPQRYNKIPADSFLYRLLQLSPPPMIGRNARYPLDEGMRLDGLEVFHAPGHAPGMVALLHHADRALICGDVFLSRGGKVSDPLGPFTYDMKLNRQSQAKLAALDFDHLFPSHGPPLMNSGRQQAQAWVQKRSTK